MRNVKAFTLIECLIAMFILGVSSLLLAQGYSQLMKITSRSSNINTSIGQQMAVAEAAGTVNSVKGTSESSMDVRLVSEGFEYVVLEQRIEDKYPNDPNNAKYTFVRDYDDGGTVKYVYYKPTLSVKDKAYDSDNKYTGKFYVYKVQPFGADHTGKGGNVLDNENKDGSEMRYVYFGK